MPTFDVAADSLGPCARLPDSSPPARPATTSSLPAPEAKSRAELLDIVARARAGDLDAQSALVRRYGSRLSAFVRPIIAQPNAVEDVVQTAFIKMARRLGALRNPETFESWLFTLARNAALDFVRQRRSRPTLVTEESQFAETPDTDSTLAVQEITEALELALLHLSPKDRRIVTMIVQGTGYRVAAQREGLSIGAVKLRLNRVRPFLRTSVGAAIGRRSQNAECFPPPPRCRSAA